MSNKATLIRELDTTSTGATVKLWRMEPPLKDNSWDDEEPESHEFVVTSAVVASFSGPETYIFPASKDGKILDFGELPGSYRGDLDHDRAIEGAGYVIREVTDEQ